MAMMATLLLPASPVAHGGSKDDLVYFLIFEVAQSLVNDIVQFVLFCVSQARSYRFVELWGPPSDSQMLGRRTKAVYNGWQLGWVLPRAEGQLLFCQSRVISAPNFADGIPLLLEPLGQALHNKNYILV